MEQPLISERASTPALKGAAQAGHCEFALTKMGRAIDCHRSLALLFVPPPFCRSLFVFELPSHLQCLAVNSRVTEHPSSRLKYARNSSEFVCGLAGELPRRHSQMAHISFHLL